MSYVHSGTSWQVTSKLNYAQTGIYLMYLGAVVELTGRII